VGEVQTTSFIPRLTALAEDVATRVAAPRAASTDKDARWPGDSMCALGEGLSALAQVTETLGKACSSTAMCFGMHSIATAVIAAKGTPYQEEHYLRPIAAGHHVTSLALSEPGSGAHFFLPRSTFRRDGEGYVVDGAKSFITSGNHADSYVVSAVAPGLELDPGTFTCLLVDQGSHGLDWELPWAGIGMRGNASCAARLNGVTVPADNLLGSEGDQLWYVFEVVAPYFLVAMAGTYLGVAQAAFDLAVAHLRQHRYEHTSERLVENAALTERVVEMWTTVERSRQLLRNAARLGDEGSSEATKALFAAKIDIAETAVAVTNTAMTLLGGRGYRENGKLARLTRDAQAAHVMSPTTHLLKSWLGRSVLGLPLL